MRSSSFSLLGLLGAFALFSSACEATLFPANTACRQCDCHMKLSGEVKADKFDEYMAYWSNVYSGTTEGDAYYWMSVKPTAPEWKGDFKVWRLCGNGPNASSDRPSGYWKVENVKEHFDCECYHSVKCEYGSRCENSGL